MPQTPHIEKHFTAGNTVRDIVIGMADGLTVPFCACRRIDRGDCLIANCSHGGFCRNRRRLHLRDGIGRLSCRAQRRRALFQ